MINETLDEVSNIESSVVNEESINIKNLLNVMEVNKPLTAIQIMEKLNIKSKKTLRNNYLNPAIEK